MKINRFDTNKSIFDFKLDHLNTEFHDHPAYEIIFSENGYFTISSKNLVHTDVYFAIVEKNVSHKIMVENVDIRILMLENYNTLFIDFLQKYPVKFKNGIYISKDRSNALLLFETLQVFSEKYDWRKTLDWRVEKCLNYFDNEVLDYHTMMKELTEEVHLSESRLSHLFKQHIGTSLKKYLVWSRLKKAILLFLNNETNLYHAALQSGFHDQAHLSKMFKKIFGVNPSDNYNSRILQN